MKMVIRNEDVEWEFIVGRIRYLFIDYIIWFGDLGDFDCWECSVIVVFSDLRNLDVDFVLDWVYLDLVV